MIGNEPAVVGVPESTPAALIVIPPAIVAGSTENVGAGEPVIPVNAKLYATPTVPSVGVPEKSGGVVVFSGAMSMVKLLTAAGATPLLAVTVIGNEPAVVGVPESTPAALIVIPPAIVAGSTENVGAGEPVIPVNAKLYAAPTVPEDGVPVKSGGTSVFTGAMSMVKLLTASGATPLPR